MIVGIHSNLTTYIPILTGVLDLIEPTEQEREFNVIESNHNSTYLLSPDILFLTYSNFLTATSMKELTNSVRLKPDTKILILDSDEPLSAEFYQKAAIWVALEYRSHSLPELETYLSSTVYLIPHIEKTTQDQTTIQELAFQLVKETTEVTPMKLKQLCHYDDLLRTYEGGKIYEFADSPN